MALAGRRPRQGPRYQAVRSFSLIGFYESSEVNLTLIALSNLSAESRPLSELPIAQLLRRRAERPPTYTAAGLAFGRAVRWRQHLQRLRPMDH